MNIQKRLASQILRASHKRVKFDNQRLADIKEAITKIDIRQLINEGAITKIQEKGVSRARARKIQKQKAKGRRSGTGSRKGKETSRLPRKTVWMNAIRSQRAFIKELKDKKAIQNSVYRELYSKTKGGFFRSTRHIKIYLEDNKLFSTPKKTGEKKQDKKEEAKNKNSKVIKK